MNYLALFHPQTTTVVLLGLLFCFFWGLLIIYKKHTLGTVTSFLILISSSDLAYFLCFYFKLSTTAFLVLFIIFFILFTIFFKRTYNNFFVLLTATDKTSALTPLTILLLSLTSVFILFYSTIDVWDASAGTHFFQAWYPLYSSYVNYSGNFNIPETANLSNGFLLSSQYYAPNSLGVVLLSAVMGVKSPNELFYIYNGFCILSTILTFAILLSSINTHKSIVPQIIFTLLFILFCTFDVDFQTVLVNNFGDEILYLAGALVCYFLISDNEYTHIDKKYLLVILASSFLALGRNYGLFFTGALNILYTGVFIHNSKNTNISSTYKTMTNFLKEHRILLLIIISLSLKEIIQILLHGTTYPRSNLNELTPYSYQLLYAGLLSGLELGYPKSGFTFNVKSIYLIALAFSILIPIYIQPQKRKQYFIGVISPLLLLLLPFLLEVFTQYRKSSDFSKLYVSFVWFPVWYIAYFYKISFTNSNMIINNKSKILIPSSYLTGVAMFVAYIILQPQYRFTNYKQVYTHIKKSMPSKLNNITRYPRHEQLLLKNLKKTFSDNKLKKIISQPVIYFHYEPGLGFRYYLGGKIENDYDFFSQSVQTKLSKSKNIFYFFCSLHLPNILYLTKKNFSKYIEHNNYQLPNWFNAQFQELLTNQDITMDIKAYELNFYIFKEKAQQTCSQSHE